MEYFNLLHFKKEPFSNSPEPEFLFAAPQYNACLQMLELAVRLKRGLNVVIGDVGTGKTTLCRKLIQNLSAPAPSDAPEIDTFLLLDPVVESPYVFVKTVAGILGISDISPEDSEWHLKEKIKKFLFEKGVDEQRIIVLIIDEGQKIPDECLEILREFLNYETNSCKLLQIIIFAQPELEKSLNARANLLDRVNYLNHLKPLTFREMKAMIKFRISVARQEPVNNPLFTIGGMLAIYWATDGYPRKVVSLCHQTLLTLIIRGKNKAGWFLVRSCIHKMRGKSYRRITWVTTSLVVAAALIFSTLFYLTEIKKHDRPVHQKHAVPAGDVKKEPLMPSAPGLSLDRTVPLLSGTPTEPVTPPEAVRAPELAKVGIGDAKENRLARLGSISIKKRITVWRILENVYGDTGQEITKQFVLANPKIKDISNTAQGDVIQVPALPDKARTLDKETIIVSLERGNDLENLYYSFIDKKDKGNMPALLFLSLRNKREGNQFVIALDKRFKSIDAAKEAIRRLSPDVAASAQVLSEWDSDTVLFNRKFVIN